MEEKIDVCEKCKHGEWVKYPKDGKPIFKCTKRGYLCWKYKECPVNEFVAK